MPGEGHEHVVERRAAQSQIRERHARLVEAPDDLGQHGAAVLTGGDGDPPGDLVDVRLPHAQAGQLRHRDVELGGVADHHLDHLAPHL